MTQLSYVSSTSSSMSASFAARRNLYIYTMSFSVHTVETTYAQTFSPSASNTMTGITSVQGTFASN